MSELRIETWSMPVADFGKENPYPPLQVERQPILDRLAPDIPEDVARNIRYGRLATLLPYTLQDGYTRERTTQPVQVAVLENEVLRAGFLLEYGGRLWSLVHKQSGRELLYRNPVIQPGNLALRNAWFCGGVEWNTGTTGHTPFTCAPLFAARLTRPDGTPVLRMYEYERWRGITYQIDACLPDGSNVLLVRVTLANPQPHESAIYWWSNIAVPEAEDVRVIVPAERAYHFDLERSGLSLVPAPVHNEVDYTYTTNTGHAADYFFDIPFGRQPYITALDGEGRGLLQTSTARLKGRKLFFWGTGSGGKHWQKFLSPEGGRYLEIQAGLANTQMEHLPMHANTRWSWTEAYGLIEADPGAVHGSNWQAARRAVEEQLHNLIAPEQLAREDALGAEIETAPVEEVLRFGSGWGAVEERRRALASETGLGGAALPFPQESITAAEQPWLALLEEGCFPVREDAASADAFGFVTGAGWLARLEESLARDEQQNWLAWYHAGVLRAHEGEAAGARQAYQKSLSLKETSWSLRGLALLAAQCGDAESATAYYRRAVEGNSEDIPLWIEAGRFLIESGQPEAFLDLLAGAAEPVRAWGRVRMLEAKAALQAGRLAVVANFFADGVEVPDLREGEDSLSDLWYNYQRARMQAEQGVTPAGAALSNEEIETRFPLPEQFDFRMR